ncbi:MAG: hypothetical protein ABIK79_16780 [Chloroflexota bacterium]|nr:hypothetical protein [Anaerolineae bacterium]
MAIVPRRIPCFRCFLPEILVLGATPTCDPVGVLATTANIVASSEATEGPKSLMGREELQRRLICVDPWAVSLQRLAVERRAGFCPACDLGQFELLEARKGSYLGNLCGHGAGGSHWQEAARGARFSDVPLHLGAL